MELILANREPFIYFLCLPTISMIRDLEWKDFDDLVGNYYSYYDEVAGDYPDMGLVFRHNKPDLEAETGWFSDLYGSVLSGNAVALVAEEGGHAVGLCDVHRKMPGSEVSHIGVLGISIRKDHRNKGIGKTLISEMLEKCRGKFNVIILGVFENNKHAIALYENLGFVRYGNLPFGVKRDDRFYGELQMYYKL